MGGRPWSEKEIATLKEVYPIFGRSETTYECFPGRTSKAIFVKATRLSLKVADNPLKRRTDKEYVGLLKDSNFIALEEYKGSHTKLMHRCKLCNYEWLTRPQHALREGANCPRCTINKLNTNEYVDDVLSKADMVRLSEYFGNNKHIKVRHKCGYEWDVSFSNIQQGQGCPACSGNFKGSDGEAILYVLEIITWSDGIFLKVGITSRKNIKSRLREITSNMGSQLIKIKVIKIVRGKSPYILNLEKIILSDNTISKFTSKLTFGGKTELKHIDYLDKILEIIEGSQYVEEIF